MLIRRPVVQARPEASPGWALPNPHSLRNGKVLVERSRHSGVKEAMQRTRVILAALLPALWLVASATGQDDSVSGFGRGRLGASISPDHNGEREASSAAYSAGQWARRWSRRFAETSGSEGSTTPAAVPQLQFPGPELTAALPPQSQPDIGLANCWQFRWRTALEPRAPSSVS